MRVKSELLLVCFTVLCCFSWVSVGYAESCDEEYLKSLADNVDVSVEFNYDALDVGIVSSHTVSVTGLTEEIYAITDNREINYFYSDVVNGVAVEDLTANIKRLDIYSVKCPKLKLRSIDLNMKYYNVRSTSLECEELKGKLAACDEFVDKMLSRDEFMKELEKYNGNKVITSVEENNVLTFIKRNYLMISSILGVIVLMVVILIILNNRKKNRLD